MTSRLPSLLACTALALLASAPQGRAAPGDIYRVSGERVNLRAGPSDDDNVRSQIVKGEELVELRRSGEWLGVRALRTGEEGWVFARLLDSVATSTLDTGTSAAAPTAGFGELSRDFDRLLAAIDERRGFRLFDQVRQNGSLLEVRASDAWLRAGSADEHTLSALALYQMWKNHQNGAPVKLVVDDAQGNPYITIDETSGSEPVLVVAEERG